MTATDDPRPAAAAAPVPVLEMRGISKTFPGVKALSGVSFAAYGGEIHALMGENGAGKSTLMKILSGAYQADPGGEIWIGGQKAVIDGPLAGRRNGIAIIYQELALSPNLTVAENMFLGEEMSKGGLIDRKAMAAAAAPVLARLDAPFLPTTKVGDLSIAERQLVEIARAVAARSRILVMDEPTTSLSTHETERLFAVIRQLKSEGIAIIYISHRMGEVYELSDRVSVLRDGAYIGTLGRAEISAEKLVRMMVGRELSSFFAKEHRAPPHDRAVLLKVEGVGDGRRIRDCSFEVWAGEVVGLSGLVGSGRTELARLVSGADRKTAGRVFIDGRECRIDGPLDAVEAGLVYLTEDRKALGVFLDMTIRENINLEVIARDALPGGFLNRSKARERADAAMKALSIRAPHTNLNVGALSGGNQQKVLLSRLLETKPKVLILDEPTRGIDIGAKSEIYRLIDALARAGNGIVVISSELPEILGTCDRVLVMRDGTIAGEVTGTPEAPITQEAIMAVATGAHAQRAA